MGLVKELLIAVISLLEFVDWENLKKFFLEPESELIQFSMGELEISANLEADPIGDLISKLSDSRATHLLSEKET